MMANKDNKICQVNIKKRLQGVLFTIEHVNGISLGVRYSIGAQSLKCFKSQKDKKIAISVLSKCEIPFGSANHGQDIIKRFERIVNFYIKKFGGKHNFNMNASIGHGLLYEHLEGLKFNNGFFGGEILSYKPSKVIEYY